MYVLFLLFPVIRAKVVGQKEVVTGNDTYGNPIKMILYDIKQTKVSEGSWSSPFYLLICKGNALDL